MGPASSGAPDRTKRWQRRLQNLLVEGARVEGTTEPGDNQRRTANNGL